MSWADWMADSPSLEREAMLEIQRRELQQLPEKDLRAVADSMIVAFHGNDHILRNAMRRIAELEMQKALVDHVQVAQKLAPQRQGQLFHVLDCGRILLQWWRRDH